ncbi:MAG: acetate kinase [Ruminococcus sp.]|nr:acetate kinase [Ruminococcus sp.]
MKILVVNAGSSSLKFNLISLPDEKELISGYFEKVGLAGGIYSIKINGSKIKKEAEMKDHRVAIDLLIKELFDNNIIKSLDEIDGIGHRVVHGGKYTKSVMVDEEVISYLEENTSLAPLHNPAHIIGIKAFKEALPNTPMVCVFDTAFHQTMDEEHYLYALPYSLYRDYQIRKYGFHGTSHRYITKVVSEKLNKENPNIISCHIGSGGSICAIKEGKSFDTTMGFTPNAGLIMGTRCGDIDYSVIPYYMKKSGKTIEEVDNMLNKESGLLGISEKYSDHRDIEAGMANNEHLAILANNMYVNRIVDYIAKYYVALNGNVDALVFTAGLGENAREFREAILEKLACLGILVDKSENNKIASYLDIQEGKISSKDSKVPVYVIPTNEELMIALDTFDFIK